MEPLTVQLPKLSTASQTSDPLSPTTAVSTLTDFGATGGLAQIEGELLKKTKNGTWHTRYFALCGPELSWRATKASPLSEAKTVLLSSAPGSECAVRDIAVGIKKFMFEVTGQGGSVSLLLGASGATEKKAWIVHLNAICTGAKPSGNNGRNKLVSPYLVSKPAEEGKGGVIMGTTPAANERLAARMAAFTSSTKCASCQEQVLNLEQVKDVLGPGKVIHRRCFVCYKCKRGLTLSTYELSSSGKLLCLAHAQQQSLGKSGGKGEAKPLPVPVVVKIEDPVVVKVEEPVVVKVEELVVVKVEEPVVVKVEEPVVAKVEEPVVAKVEELIVKPEEPVVKVEELIAKPEEPVAAETVATKPLDIPETTEQPAVAHKTEEEPVAKTEVEVEEGSKPLPISSAFSTIRRLSGALLPMRRSSVSTTTPSPAASPATTTGPTLDIPLFPKPPAATTPSVKSLGLSLKIPMGAKPPPSTASQAFSNLVKANNQELDNTVQLAKPTVPSGRRRKPSMMPGTLLHQPAMELDRVDSECTFKAKFEDGQVICMHASSVLERDAWVNTLCNLVQFLELHRLLQVAQKIDMQSAMQCQLDIEHFSLQNHSLEYAGFLEKLSIKSQRNWKKRWFELSPKGEFKYSSDDKSKKPKHQFQLGPGTQILSHRNEVLSGNA
ncbi:hypothetical protein BASA81_004486 [Batrachochytrium salamandrivorans]|nr:hypothetical protein BASA81_004486 [Batrachochytrium salamandrivorans]